MLISEVLRLFCQGVFHLKHLISELMLTFNLLIPFGIFYTDYSKKKCVDNGSEVKYQKHKIILKIGNVMGTVKGLVK